MSHRPNISRDKHTARSCVDQDWREQCGRPGDVRRCRHGRIQLLTPVPEHHPVQGPGTHWWRDLSKFWDPILYRRAAAAL